MNQQRHKRSKSQDRLLSMPDGGNQTGGKDFGLSARSALNDRYFNDAKSTRSKSLDNLLPAGGAGAGGAANAGEENFFGLSESKLNQRYLSQECRQFRSFSMHFV